MADCTTESILLGHQQETKDSAKGESMLVDTQHTCSSTDGHEKDLPLRSNVKDIHIFHYILELKCSFERKELSGSITLFRCSELMDCVKCSKISHEQQGYDVKLSKLDNKKLGTEHNFTHLYTSYKYNDNIVYTLADCRNVTNALNSVGGNFKMVLDCCDIQINSVEELDMPIDLILNIGQDDSFQRFKTLTKPIGPLQWSQDKVSLTVWKDGISFEKNFPDVIRVRYKTSLAGQSLKWTVDQDGRWCVFTHGHWINNRSLFPSQDAPTAMATWQAEIEVRDNLQVVMSGDELNKTSNSEDQGWKKEYFKTNLEMPSSTLSIAIGEWERLKIDMKKILETSKNLSSPLPSNKIFDWTVGVMKTCHVIGPSSILNDLDLHFQKYICFCVKEITTVLGAHPFKRLDVLIVPPCFDSLGMACPSVMYLSHSLLSKDCSMFVRISHEMCHSWFGLLIGPKDWTEEWLTEGFCSYLEDIVHLKVKQAMDLCDEKEQIEERQLRNYLKFKTLENELNTTEDGLQMLRPNKEQCQDSTSGYVKDGMNPDKRFLQVHYLKGHFLLCYLEKFVGTEKFLNVIHAFVLQFHKELVSSQDVILFILSALPELREHITEQQIYAEWLDTPGMPTPLKGFQISKENSQYQLVEKQVVAIKNLSCKQGDGNRKRIKIDNIHLDSLTSLQQVICLEMLLEEESIAGHILTSVKNFYNLMEQNADVQHRWCELVIKHKVKRHYEDVKYFLLHHQAMGVYLFGELMISGCKQQKKMAKECFDLLKEHMEPDPYQTVKAMLFGT